MSDLSLVVSILDGSDGLSDLALSRANGYRVARGGIGPGARLWRRQVAENLDVDGRILVDRSLDIVVAPLHVRIFGASDSEFTTRMAALMDRMEQASFVLEEVVASTTYRWQCECADSAIGDAGTFDTIELAQYQQVLRFTVPRQPVPLAGRL